MKNRICVFFAIFVFALSIILFLACSSDKKEDINTKDIPKTSLTKSKLKLDKTMDKKTIPTIASLQKNDSKVAGFITKINDNIVAKSKQPILITQDTLEIGGWCIDESNQSLPAAVYININGKNYLAKNKLNRKAIAKRYGNNFLKSGFALSLPTSILKQGENLLSFRVVSKNLKEYYFRGQKVKIILK